MIKPTQNAGLLDEKPSEARKRGGGSRSKGKGIGSKRGKKNGEGVVAFTRAEEGRRSDGEGVEKSLEEQKGKEEW